MKHLKMSDKQKLGYVKYYIGLFIIFPKKIFWIWWLNVGTTYVYMRDCDLDG